MKAVIWILVLLAVAVIWHRHNSKHSSGQSASHWASSKLVIEYNTDEELLGRLRAVKAYREIELRHIGSDYFNTGIACSDTAGKQAYMENQEAVARAINEEMQRISRLPH
ncbi:MAG: hypothetical protein PHE83_00535 [Opitutaceae bacterium]|nr:hypothetical protein [Opitutaceae bacterium]